MDLQRRHDLSKIIPAAGNTSAYQQFISSFGTHYMSSITLGARFGTLQVASSDAVNQFQSQGRKWEVGAQATYKQVTVGASHMSDEEKAASQAWTNTVKSSTSFFVGSDPISAMQGDIAAWKAKIGKSPMPMGGAVAPILDLLTAAHFPDDLEIGAKFKAHP